MSNRLFQSMVLQLKESTDRVIGVIDMEGNVIACTDLPSIGERMPHVLTALSSERDAAIVVDGRTFKPWWAGVFSSVMRCLSRGRFRRQS